MFCCCCRRIRWIWLQSIPKIIPRYSTFSSGRVSDSVFVCGSRRTPSGSWIRTVIASSTGWRVSVWRETDCVLLKLCWCLQLCRSSCGCSRRRMPTRQTPECHVVLYVCWKLVSVGCSDEPFRYMFSFDCTVLWVVALLLSVNHRLEDRGWVSK